MERGKRESTKDRKRVCQMQRRQGREQSKGTGKDQTWPGRRSRRRRWVKNDKETDTVKSQFLTSQSLGKAVRKVHKSLPKNPEKVPELSVGKLVYQLSPQKRKAVISACDTNAKRRKVEGERIKRSDSLSEEEIRQIEEFYLRDDISRTSTSARSTCFI